MSCIYDVIMVKKMLYLEPEQDEIVKRLAREGKTSETEVIRRAIAAYGDANAAKIAADTHRVMERLREYPQWNDDPAEFFQG
uniref:Ribbon-helix-helix protein CopG domain-containing protein n=1 Tax=mine drainage metagenome TaxID=410659 RepID=E6Q1S6_9ZZZZ